MERFAWLDGLRGVLAIGVVLWHVEFSKPLDLRSACGVARFAFSIFADGGFSVALFFVISGFCLAGAGARGTRRRAIGRYPRLAPVTAAAGVACALLSPRCRLRDVPGLLAYASFYCFFPPASAAYIATPIARALAPPPWTDDYLTPLWTMSVEMRGSLVIFLLEFACSEGQYTTCLAGAYAIAALADPGVSYFVLGAFMRRRWAAECEGGDRHGQAASAAVAEIVLHYATELAVARDAALLRWVSQTVRATLVFACAARSPSIFRRILECRPAQTLGRLSFGIYVSHSLVYRALGERGAPLMNVALVRIVTVLLCTAPVAYGLSYVDARAAEAARRLADALTEPAPANACEGAAPVVTVT